MKQIKQLPSAYVLHLMLMLISAATEGAVIVPEAYGPFCVGMSHRSTAITGCRMAIGMVAPRRHWVCSVHSDLTTDVGQSPIWTQRLPTLSSDFGDGIQCAIGPYGP